MNNQICFVKIKSNIRKIVIISSRQMDCQEKIRLKIEKEVQKKKLIQNIGWKVSTTNKWNKFDSRHNRIRVDSRIRGARLVVARAYSRQLIPYLAVKSNLAGRRKSDRLSFAIEGGGGMRGISGNPSPTTRFPTTYSRPAPQLLTDTNLPRAPLFAVAWR